MELEEIPVYVKNYNLNKFLVHMCLVKKKVRVLTIQILILYSDILVNKYGYFKTPE